MADKEIKKVVAQVDNTTITIEPDDFHQRVDEFLLTFRVNGIGGRTCVTVDDDAISVLEAAIAMYKKLNRR